MVQVVVKAQKMHTNYMFGFACPEYEENMQNNNILITPQKVTKPDQFFPDASIPNETNSNDHSPHCDPTHTHPIHTRLPLPTNTPKPTRNPMF